VGIKLKKRRKIMYNTGKVMYNTGKEFVDDLNEKYGMLEAHRMGCEYLRMNWKSQDPEEVQFCKEVKKALWDLDRR
jgi:hypothetical protein